MAKAVKKGATLGKTQLVEYVADRAGLSKAAAKAAVDATFGTITEALKQGGKVQITGFGTFAVTKRKKRTGINPQTKEKINIPAKKAPKFTPGKTLKEVVK